MTTNRIAELIESFSVDSNFSARLADVWTIANAAEAAGVSETTVDVWLDHSAPEVARLRTLATIGARLAALEVAAAPTYESKRSSIPTHV